MTAYRQQALACALALSRGPRRVKDLRPEIPDAPKILLRNVYGWFDRAERGIYVLTDAGHAALKRISGHTQILPPTSVRSAIGRGRVKAMLRLCLSIDGRVTVAEITASSGYLDYDAEIVRHASAWRIAWMPARCPSIASGWFTAASRRSSRFNDKN